MQYRRLGQCGLKVSAISLGGWLTFGDSVDRETTSSIVRAAIDGGINFIDLADVYAKGEAERATGAAIQGYPRHELVISSKVFWPMSNDPNDRGLSRKHIIESVDRSLRRLGTDYLDIYFCHREDPDVPLEETVGAMSDLVCRGKILHWGTSVWNPRTLVKAHRAAERCHLHAPVVEQPPYNLLQRSIEKGLIPTAQKLGMGLVVWSPLAGGILTGKYNQGLPEGSRGATTKWLNKDLNEPSLARVRKFCELAKNMSVQPAALALAWLLHRPGISSVITGATHTDQLNANLKAMEIKLSNDASDDIDRIFANCV